MFIHNVFIDQDYILKYGLKSKVYEKKKTYWRVIGHLVISQYNDDIATEMIGFGVALPAGEKTFGGTELIFEDDGAVVEFDKSILKTDLKEKLDNFIKILKNHAICYNTIFKFNWKKEGSMTDYNGWIELKVQKYPYKVSLYNLPNWAV